jgi:dipeptidase D
MRRLLVTLSGLAVLASAPTAVFPQLKSILDQDGPAMLGQLRRAGGEPGVVFARFVDTLASEVYRRGDRELAARLREAVLAPGMPEFPLTEIAWITQTFAREMYRDSVVARTAALLTFRTVADTMPNRRNPEFDRQKAYLQALALQLGLRFRDVGGYVYEISAGDGPASFGLMCHGDVQPADPAEWTKDPWGGEVSAGKIWGRGSVDDKGPVIAIMYGMRAILDTGIPLSTKLVLLVGTDEESANEDVAEYLKVAKAPDRTIVVDEHYPVICAEKGWGGVWLHIRRQPTVMSEPGYYVTDISSGFSPSIVPERAIAKIIPRGMSREDARRGMSETIARFKKRRPNSRITFGIVQDTVFLTAHGKSVHSSEPGKGYNALMDMLVFLDRDLKVVTNDVALMAKFAAGSIGFEQNGRSLGIAHRDPFMGDLTVAGTMFQVTDTTVMFMFNIRIPKGITGEKIQSALAQRFGAFVRKHGVEMFDHRWLGEAHYQDPQGPYVQRLLRIYNRVTGEKERPRSTSGGTYAHRLPNAVVFGPALPKEEYLGHRPDEYLLVSTLLKNVEILTHTMVEFGFGGVGEKGD